MLLKFFAKFFHKYLYFRPYEYSGVTCTDPSMESCKGSFEICEDWDGGEPNDASVGSITGREDCVIMETNEKWRDVSCNDGKEYSFVCERGKCYKPWMF